MDPFAEPGHAHAGRGRPSRALGLPNSEDDPDLDPAALLPEGDAPSPEELQALSSLQQMLGGGNLSRRPNLVFQALIERQKNPAAKPVLPPPGAKPADTEPPDEEEDGPRALSPLAIRLLTSDWQTVREVLAALPKGQAPIVYTGLLAMFAQDASGVVLPQDVLALADLSPAELDDAQLALLGKLAQRSLDESDRPRALLQRRCRSAQPAWEETIPAAARRLPNSF